ncbi:MAG: hypothetical protein LBO79_09235 [Zoogloeaceae bacterium]|nr:hypothetical protein [Zoogloeaceae bacterium]
MMTRVWLFRADPRAARKPEVSNRKPDSKRGTGWSSARSRMNRFRRIPVRREKLPQTFIACCASPAASPWRATCLMEQAFVSVQIPLCLAERTSRQGVTFVVLPSRTMEPSSWYCHFPDVFRWFELVFVAVWRCLAGAGISGNLKGCSQSFQQKAQEGSSSSIGIASPGRFVSSRSQT